jgi:hypothetical protein
MFKRPYVAGIDSRRLKDQDVSLERLLQMYGNNLGNMFFAEALYRTLSNAKRGSMHFHPRETEDCDVIVVAAANWLNPHSDFGPLAERLEKTGLPVVLVGVGAQSGKTYDIPAICDGTLKFLRLVSETSKVISTRGGFSARVLEHYGFRDVLATGCPSLLMNGVKPTPLRDPRGAVNGDVVIQSTRHLRNKCDAFQASLYRKAIKGGHDIVLQSELADMYPIAGVHEKDADKARSTVQWAYDAPYEVAAAYLATHGKIFFSVDEWVDFMRTKRFCFGTRLHGTVASLLAGTPAVLIGHDSRTIETAQAMNLPLITDPNDVSNPVTYYCEDAVRRYIDGYERYLYNFKAFFRLNGLEANFEG